MTTAYTSLLGLALPVTGELQGTWGDTVNNSITSLLDTAVAGTTTLSTDGDVTLTTTTGASNQARQAILLCSGARTAVRTITAPAQSKIYTIINATTGGYAVKIVGAGPTTGITIPAGQTAQVAWNGSDFVDASNYVGGNLKVNGNLSVTGTSTLTGAITSNLIFTDNTYDIGASGATRPRNLYLSNNGVIGSKLAIGLSSATYTLDVYRPTTGTVAQFSSSGQAGLYLASGDATNPYFNLVYSNATTPVTALSQYYQVSDAALYFKVGSAQTSYVTFDSNANIGVNMLPYANWPSTSSVISLATNGAIFGETAIDHVVNIAKNKNDGNKWYYQTTAGATQFVQGFNYFDWYIAGSGTGGTDATPYLERYMRIDTSGRLNVGSGGLNTSESLNYTLGIYRGTQNVAAVINCNNGYNAYVNFASYSGSHSFGYNYGQSRFQWSNTDGLDSTVLLSLNDNGVLALYGGTTTASGVGIAFPASVSNSSNANTLDDYERAEYTVTLTGAAGGSFTLTANTGWFVKIGRLVTVGGELQISSVGSATGAYSLISIPFPAANLSSSAERSAGSVSTVIGAGAWTAQATGMQSGSAGMVVEQACSLWSSAGTMRFQFSYYSD